MSDDLVTQARATFEACDTSSALWKLPKLADEIERLRNRNHALDAERTGYRLRCEQVEARLARVRKILVMHADLSALREDAPKILALLDGTDTV